MTTPDSLPEEAVEAATKAAEEAATYEWVGRPYVEMREIDNWPEIARAAILAYQQAVYAMQKSATPPPPTDKGEK